MAELAVRDGYPPPGDLPRGDCTMTSLYGEDGIQTGIRIDHADPRILISAELLAMVYIEPAPGVSLSGPPAAGNGTPFWEGAVLRIEAVNRTVIYRITEYVPAVRGYVAEWPD